LMMMAPNSVGLNRAVTTPRLCWLPARAHMNWPRQEGYVPASESRTQARAGKNNLEL
jgi:hypothetical protein